MVTPVDDGTGLTVTTVVYTVEGLQPGAALLLTVSEKVVVTEGVNVGFCAEELVPSDPFHDQEVALVEFAFTVTVAPAQIGPEFVGAAIGVGLTVTIVVLVHPKPNVLEGTTL